MDTLNKFGVSIKGGDVVILTPPRVLTPAQAMELAAWLVVMANIQSEELSFIDTYIASVQEA